MLRQNLTEASKDDAARSTWTDPSLSKTPQFEQNDFEQNHLRQAELGWASLGKYRQVEASRPRREILKSRLLAAELGKSRQV